LFEPRQAAAENPLLMPEPPPAPPPLVEIVRPTPIIGGTPTTAIAMPVTPPMRRQEEAVARLASPDPSAAETDARVVLRFTSDTWVQVKERGGQILVSKVMRAGDTFPVPIRPNLILTTGNAGGMEVLVDGAAVPPIGGTGVVRKDVPLEPDQLKSGAVVPVSTKR
jgi:cytoskeleton protein RodZ